MKPMTALTPPVTRGPSPWMSHVMRVVAVRPEIAGVQTLDLVFRDASVDYGFLPGQFNMLGLPGIGECAISIATDPAAWPPPRGEPVARQPTDGAAPPTAAVAPRTAKVLQHTFRAVGNVTHPLARLQIGDEVILRGPFGSAWPLHALRGHDVIIAAGGLGLASVRSAILHIARHRTDYGSVAILHGAKTPPDLLYTGDYERWRSAGLDVLTIVDRADEAKSGPHHAAPGATGPGAPCRAATPWTGPVGFVPALFDALDVAAGATGVLCCGPEPMMAAVAARAHKAGIAAERIWLSLERNMACAAGFCGLCQFGPSFVCKDGPVFPQHAIAPFLAVRHL